MTTDRQDMHTRHSSELPKPFAPDVMSLQDGTAWVERPWRSLGATGQARKCQWVLRLEPKRRRVDHPLTSRSGGGDSLQQIGLRGPAESAAAGFPRRQGLDYTVYGHDVEPKAGRRRGPAAIDLELALQNPASVFDSPDAVLDHPLLTRAEKREILRRWEWDARLIELAEAEAMPEGEPSRLDEVRRALLALDGGPTGPDQPPSAPAAAPIPRVEATEDLALAA